MGIVDNMVIVPNDFQKPTIDQYPPNNHINFEEWFYLWFCAIKPQTDRVYLPILWHTYYLGENFGRTDTKCLEGYLRTLDPKLKYFTITQFDGGILQDISFLDLYVFGCCGSMDKYKDLPSQNRGYPIGLICAPGPKINTQYRDTLVSFIGQIDGRHPIRERIRNIWQYDNEMYIKSTTTYSEFINVMSRSWFALCPRGMGWQSFRICEALYYGAIPIYISDHKWIPWQEELNFNDIGIILEEKEIPYLKDIIKTKSKADIERYQKNGKEAYQQFFTFDGQAQKIIQKLNDHN